MNIDITRALAIDGWMSEPELTWLATEALAHKLIVEVGCWQGRSTRVLADHTPGIVIAVDTFAGFPEVEWLMLQQSEGWLWEAFRRNMGTDLNVKVIPTNRTSEASAHLLARSLKRPDMVFIDASHDEQSVRADIMAWRMVMAPKGLLCGHDYYDDGSDWQGVKAAVDALIPDRLIVPDTRIWVRP